MIYQTKLTDPLNRKKLTLSRPGLFSRSSVRGTGGGGGTQRPGYKNQGYHQLIEIKLCMSH